MSTPNELTKLNLPSLLINAQQLQVVLNVDKDLLAEEISPYVVGLSGLRLAVDKLAVTDQESSDRACQILNEAAGREKALTAIWARYKTPLNAARTVVLAMEKQTAGEAEAIKKKASEKVGAYQKILARQKQQVEARVQRTVDNHRADLLREAEDLEMEGNIAAGRAKRAEAEMTVAPTLPDLAPPPSNARVTPKHKGTVSDILSVLKAIVDGKIPLVHEVKPGDSRPLVVVDQVVLNAIVSRQGLGTNIPGVTVEEDIHVGARPGVR